MICSLSSPRALSSVVPAPRFSASRFCRCNVTPTPTPLRTRQRLAVRLGSASEGAAAASTTQTDEDALRAQMAADWATARSYLETGAIYDGEVEGFNNGGLLIKFYSLIGFLPYTLLNQAPFCKGCALYTPTEANKKAIELMKLKSSFSGPVTYQLQYKPVPHEVFNFADIVFLLDRPKPILERARDLVGSPISVKVVTVDEEKRSLVFSEKDASWSRYITQVELGSVYDGLVASVADYGAFVHIRFPDGVYRLTGLVHISEASWDTIQDMRNLFAAGDEVKVKVIDIDSEKKRMSLSIKQLENDPLYATLDKVITESGDVSGVSDENIEPLPGLDSICEELLKEDGITDVQLGRQGLEKRAVSQDLELWLSNAPVKDKKFTLLARAGRQVQEIYLTSTLDQDGIKKAVQRILERVP